MFREKSKKGVVRRLVSKPDGDLVAIPSFSAQRLSDSANVSLASLDAVKCSYDHVNDQSGKDDKPNNATSGKE